MPNFLKAISVIVFIALLIGSFYLGSTFEIVTPITSYHSTTQHNWPLTIAGLVFSFLTFLLFFSVGFALEQLQAIRQYTYEIGMSFGVTFVEDIIDSNGRKSKKSTVTLLDVLKKQLSAIDSQNELLSRLSSQESTNSPNAAQQGSSRRRQASVSNSENAPEDSENADTAYLVEGPDAFSWACSSCGRPQRKDRTRCLMCGKYFASSIASNR